MSYKDEGKAQKWTSGCSSHPTSQRVAAGPSKIPDGPSICSTQCLVAFYLATAKWFRPTPSPCLLHSITTADAETGPETSSDYIPQQNDHLESLHITDRQTFQLCFLALNSCPASSFLVPPPRLSAPANPGLPLYFPIFLFPFMPLKFKRLSQPPHTTLPT